MAKTLSIPQTPSSCAPANVQEVISRKMDHYMDTLMALCRLPGISSQGFKGEALCNTAKYLRTACTDFGFDEVEEVELESSAPFLIATAKSPNPKAPTLLIYAHYDVQPIGNPHLWHSPAFSPTIRDGRLFGRGTADDKTGVVAALAAVHALRSAHETLPVHLKLVLDGEEESGSPNMEAFLKTHKKRLTADYLLVPDLVNPDINTPSLTFCLRGLIEFKIRISVMKKPIHSGLTSGVVPDPTQALALLFAQATGPKGEVTIPGVALAPSRIPKPMLRSLDKFVLNLKHQKKEFNLLPTTRLLHEKARAYYQALWFMPSMTLVQTQIAEPKNYANRLQPEVEAIFSLRISPLQRPEAVIKALKKYFTTTTPFGLKVDFTLQHQGAGFFTDPEQRFFKEALHAVGRAYEKPAVALGAGLTIPFVELIQKNLGEMKTLLLGVEDPQSNAHAENESVALSMFERTIRSIANIFYAVA